jgi:hypothetical protein
MLSGSSGEPSPLITVWLQVRVLPGPPMRSNTWLNSHFCGGPFRGPVTHSADQSTRADHPSRVLDDGRSQSMGETAQVAYQPDFFAPGHLLDDPSFGWLLGCLIPEGGSLPSDDPLLANATLMR